MPRAFTYITDIPVFRSLTDEDTELIGRNACTKIIPAKSIIQMEGNPATIFAVMTHGLAKGVLYRKDGREILLHFYKPGDFFGEMNLSGISECPFTICAVKKSEFILIAIDTMVELIRRNGKFAYALFSFVTQQLSRSQKRLRDTIYERGEDKILKYFEDLAMQIGVQKGDNIEIPEKFSHQVIADTCGFSRETVTRHLSQMQKNGILSQTADAWVLKKKG